ncbi:MAG: tRNA-uridine aminocarboxypropyltransferase [Arcobacter sp.]|uniref:tRNA-uridine aminocarboxypropyltransferase n=1 Tax=Arcobacter sp. TaxID=1872629 RepID=UPI002589705A|nr:tRNA-uridine aminocarboxypropyltransferase [Arcobacter sp.]MDD3007915.1 DTW domain-containing protein [Arcobacter sp.]MDY3204628.1 tRNA-uridine aminocarboxypropyltransferase [Arcobacter sp.]
MQIKNQRGICYKCYRPKSSCICEHLINPIKTNTKFVILMHPKEFRKTKNGTGHMTNNSLENCELHVGIDFSNHKRVNELLNDENYEAYVLYPDTNSIKLNSEKLPSEKKALIFIIDSTWPCSKKMLRLSKNLQNLKKVSFEHDKSSQFKIKTQPNQYCLSTIESTLCVLEQLNNQEVENISKNSLELFLKPFEEMVEYQVKCAIDENNIRFKVPYKKFVK